MLSGASVVVVLDGDMSVVNIMCSHVLVLAPGAVVPSAVVDVAVHVVDNVGKVRCLVLCVLAWHDT